MFHVVQNQLNSYTAALPDVMTYVMSALSSDTYVQTTGTASELILFSQLFEELNNIKCSFSVLACFSSRN